jgi:hypothetical protein
MDTYFNEYFHRINIALIFTILHGDTLFTLKKKTKTMETIPNWVKKKTKNRNVNNGTLNLPSNTHK